MLGARKLHFTATSLAVSRHLWIDIVANSSVRILLRSVCSTRHIRPLKATGSGWRLYSSESTSGASKLEPGQGYRVREFFAKEPD